MTQRKASTMDLKGNDYAKVPERIKLFREDCPNGSIKSEPKFLENGQVLFTAYILKDKADPNSADATGHAIGNIEKDKALERLETISIGRALAILGYLASGEIASSEEMEEFNEYKSQQKEEAVTTTIDAMNAAKTIEEVRKIGRESNLLSDPKVVEAGKLRVAEITAKEFKNEDSKS